VLVLRGLLPAVVLGLGPHHVEKRAFTPQALYRKGMSAMFFQGSVAEAIAASRREVKPLIVLLTGATTALIQRSSQIGSS
jgi:hypothetical protein